MAPLKRVSLLWAVGFLAHGCDRSESHSKNEKPDSGTGTEDDSGTLSSPTTWDKPTDPVSTGSESDNNCPAQGQLCAGHMKGCCPGLGCGGSGFGLECVPP